MSLTREFLQSQGLEKEVIDDIMVKHGQTVNPLNDKISSLETVKSQLEEQVSERDSQMQRLKAEGNDELSAKIEQLEADNQAKALENDQLRKVHAIELAVEISGTTAKDYLKYELSQLEFKDGELAGLEEKLKTIKETQPQLFEVAIEQESPKKWSQGGVSTINDQQPLEAPRVDLNAHRITN